MEVTKMSVEVRMCGELLGRIELDVLRKTVATTREGLDRNGLDVLWEQKLWPNSQEDWWTKDRRTSGGRLEKNYDGGYP